MKYLPLIVAFGVCSFVSGEQIIEQDLSRESELSEFKQALEKDPNTINFLSGEEGATLFAPTNEAIRKFGGSNFRALLNDGKFIRNFISLNNLVELSVGPIASFGRGNPTLFINSVDGMYYVNNAKILRKASSSRYNIYLIDTILIFPYTNSKSVNAFELIKDLSSHLPSVKDKNVYGFVEAIEQTGARELFERSGDNTFFVPLNGNGRRNYNLDIIKTHIIHNQLVFSQTFFRGPYNSLNWRDNGPSFEISFQNETLDWNKTIVLVKSADVTRKAEDGKGAILTRLEFINIPVSNGVVHLIGQPLGAPTLNLLDFVNNEQIAAGRFNDFLNFARGTSFFSTLQRQKQATLFIPSNKAFRLLPTDVRESYNGNSGEREKIVMYHLLEGKRITEAYLKSHMVSTSLNAGGAPLVVRQVTCAGNCRFDSGANTSIVVECAGVNATVTTAEMEATDGLVYIIDRILGAPTHSIGYKLQTEEDTAISQVVATKGHWNRILDDQGRSFTLFAPSNQAWEYLRENYHDDYRRLVQEPTEIHAQAANIMSRHVVSSKLMLEDLRRLPELRTENDNSKIGVEHRNNEVYIEWNGIRARIVKSDITATNGVMHIIDKVMYVHNDLNGTFRATSSISIIFGALVMAACFIGRL